MLHPGARRSSLRSGLYTRLLKVIENVGSVWWPLAARCCPGPSPAKVRRKPPPLAFRFSQPLEGACG